MKKIILALFIGIISLAAKAQVGFNYSQYELGISASFLSPKTDFQRPASTAAFHAHFTYNFTPYINYIAELQIGSLKADSLNEFSGINFTNNYTTLGFRVQLQAGEFVDYSQSQTMNALKNFYVSTGLGVIYTDLKINQSGMPLPEAQGSNIFIPIKFGYEFKLFNDYSEPWAKIDLGYQLNYLLSDNLDGFPSGNFNDAFTQFVVGVKFGIGGKTSYRKSISY